MARHPENIPEDKLLSALKKGDEKAYETIFRRYWHVVEKFCTFILEDKAEARDVAQDIFMKLWTARETLDPEKSLRSYLFVLSKNAALSRLSKTGRTLSSESVPEVIAEKGTEDNIILEETRQRLELCIKDMPPRRKEIFRLSREEGLSEKEIAQRLGLSVRTVEKHIELALKTLRRIQN